MDGNQILPLPAMESEAKAGIVPSSREAALFSRRALRQRENKQACLRPRDRFWGRVDGRISPDALSLCRPGR
ncbi:hypothetical protein [Thiolapillus sp.]|uniref:hypothetical protein n=1 Tax=Thiolapillus sp. TaxID=2017437 RepID=UPI003AF796FB